MQEIDILVQTKFLLLLFIALLGLMCGDLSEFEKQRIEVALSDSLFNSRAVWGLESEILEDGILKFRLKSPMALMRRPGDNSNFDRTFLSGPVEINIYKDNGELDANVYADSALYRPPESSFELYGSVRVIHTNGNKLFTEYLRWERSKDLISTDRFLILLSPPDSISANGFESNLDLTNYTLIDGSGEAVIN